MAINKIIYGNDTLIDITDTTAEAEDVTSGKVFYTKSGARSVGTASYIPSVLTSDYYGTTLPAAGTEGRIFFLKVQ